MRRILTLGFGSGRRRDTGGGKGGPARRKVHGLRRWALVSTLPFMFFVLLPVLAIGALGVPEEVKAAIDAGKSAWDAIKGTWSSATGVFGGGGGAGGQPVGAVAAGEIPAEYVDDFNGTVTLGIDPRLVAAVAYAESSFQPYVYCEPGSQAAAQGIMQITPGTAAYLGVNPCVPEEAIPGGARYLMEQFNTFGTWELAIAAYNAGPDAVRRYDNTIPPYTETQNYVPKVMGKWQEYQQLFPSGTLGAPPGAAGATPERAEVLRRAQTWIDLGGVPYSMSAYHDGWRTDCSGYVSMAWGLAQPGATTVTLASTHAVPIDRSQLMPGDILLDADSGSAGHVMLFERWDADPNYLWVYEQAAGAGGTVHRRIAYPSSEYAPYRSRTLP